MDKVLTAEETLSKITGEEGLYITHGMIRGSEALEAMDIYAKQLAIGFAEWCGKNGWKFIEDEGLWVNTVNLESPERSTTEQLYSDYEMYLQSLNK